MKLQIDKLKKLVQGIEIFSQTDLVDNEANTKKKLIEPLLDILGWELLGNEVRLEYPIQVGTSSVHADYALIIEGKPVVLVEAKAFDVDLSNEQSSQIISYGRVEDVRWVVLTNGRLLKILDARAGRTEKDCLVTEVDLREADLHTDDLSLISRESVLSGEIEEAARRLAAVKKAMQSLKQKKQEIADEFKKVLVRIAGSDVENRAESISRQLTDQAIQLFEKQAQPPSDHPPTREVQTVVRKDLASKPQGEVVVCPSRIEGVEFLRKYNAWGFVEINRKVPYFALYVGRPESSVLYFGEVESITQPIKSKEDLARIEEKYIETFPAGKRVIHLKAGTLVKFENPILLGNKRSAPRGLRYTTLERLTEAHNVSDL